MDGMVTAAPPVWPSLREELSLFPGPVTVLGAPTWTLYDPTSHRYFRLGVLEFECLQRWLLGNAEQIAAAISQTTPLVADADDVESFKRFLANHQLIKPDDAETVGRLATQHHASRPQFWTWLLHNYLFMRIPVLRPDPYLKRLQPWLGFLFRPYFVWFIILMASVAAYRVAQQWAVFSHAFVYVFTPEGMLATAAMLSLSKLVHELGHAITASHFGCRVPTMGVALLMGLPVLWTDVTDAWRLPQRRQRLLIDAAGMLAELALAAVASLLWTVLPDGALRSGLYLLASAAWLITLTINLNPFMRFDGYYLLSDYLDIANLQDRSFALARWHLRESVLALKLPPPEYWTRRQQLALISYAYSIWVYRLLLFAGIAWAVYHFFFKALGLGLFAVEIGWFIIRPIYKELAVWRELKNTLKVPLKLRRIGLIPALVLALLLLPWHSQLLVPGLLQADRELTLYSPLAAQVQQVFVHEGEQVSAGQVLVTLHSPDLAFKQQAARQRLAELTGLLASQSVDASLAWHNAMDLEALQSTVAELQGLDDAQAKLTLRASFSGQVRDLSEALRVGEWLTKDEVVGVVASPQQTVVAYIEEADLGRLTRHAQGRFYPDGGDLAVFPVQVLSIDDTGTRQLAVTELASTFGGAVAVREDGERHLIPEQGLYRVLLSAQTTTPLPISVRGRLALTTPAESLAGRLFRELAAVLVRESGW